MIQSNYDLTTHNSLRLASQAKHYAHVQSQSQLLDALRFARSQSLPIVILGDGSNVVLGERLDALVIQMALKGIRVLEQSDQEVLVEVAAGENWHDWVLYCLDQGWHGLENLALIPGSVGAAPIQNIGAYGVEVAECIECVNVIDVDPAAANVTSLQTQSVGRKDCEFAYRDSLFKRRLQRNLTDSIEGRSQQPTTMIVSVQFRLSKRFTPCLSYPALADALQDNARWAMQTPAKDLSFAQAQSKARLLVDSVVAIRRSKLPDPAVLPNAGSFFKNVLVSVEQLNALQRAYDSVPYFSASPAVHATAASETATAPARAVVKLPAAWLIEQSGFKAYVKDGVGTHSEQPLVIVNHAHSEGRSMTADALLPLAREIQQAVLRQFGIALEMEPIAYGCAI